MNTIIAVRGKSNVGKTETIKSFYSLLLSEYPTAEITHELTGADIRAIITINGVKIGIESQGDPSSRLYKSIPLFVKNKCKIIICATRSRGKTVELLKKQKNYSIVWHEQVIVKNKENHSSSNAKMARVVFDETVKLINA